MTEKILAIDAPEYLSKHNLKDKIPVDLSVTVYPLIYDMLDIYLKARKLWWCFDTYDQHGTTPLTGDLHNLCLTMMHAILELGCPLQHRSAVPDDRLADILREVSLRYEEEQIAASFAS
jgi:hypothetical protein